MARLNHPHVLRIYDVGEQDEQHYVVMDLAEGGSLEDLLRRRGPLPPDTALRYMLQLLSALAAAHQVGVVHRDVKPANVLLDKVGNALLADFGIALITDRDDGFATRAGAAMGSMAFMAPEQRQDAHTVGPQADVYAAGCTLYQLLTLRSPMDLFVFGDKPERWEGIPEELVQVLKRATQHAPIDRYPDARSLAVELVALLPNAGDQPLTLHQDAGSLLFPNPSTQLRQSVSAGLTQGSTKGPDERALLAAITFLIDHVEPPPPPRNLKALPPQPVTPTPAPGTLVPDELPITRNETLVPSVDFAPERSEAALPGDQRESDRPRIWPMVLAGLALMTALGLFALKVSDDDRRLEELRQTTSPVQIFEQARLRKYGDPAAPITAGVQEKEEEKAGPEPTPEGVTPARVVAVGTAAPPPEAAPRSAPVKTAAAPPEASTGGLSGSWTGSFGGRPATFRLTGSDQALRGEVSVTFAGNAISTPVAGGLQDGKLVLEDTEQTPDAGRYVLQPSEDGRQLNGTFTTREGGRVLPVLAFRR